MNSILKEIALDSLATSVWGNKYKLGNEQNPQDTIQRLIKEFTSQLYTNAKNWKLSDDLSPHGKMVCGMSQNTENKTRKRILTELVRDSLGFDKIIPGGSAIFGIGNMEANSSISNCFVIDYPHDSLEGINYRINEMCCLEKARGGVGVNLSSLRPKGATVKNQSKTSTGVETFVIDFSQNNNIVAQDGRRGALMICLDVNHPDVLDFVRLKEDLTKVTGANLSVLIDDAFMWDVIYDNEYITSFPLKTRQELSDIFNHKNPEALRIAREADYGQMFKIGDSYFKKFSAKSVWEEICRCAWKMAEPGILFRSNWITGGTDGVYPQYRPVATNPCSEIAMQPYDSCRLMSYNLTDCVVNPYTSKAYVDFDRLYEMSYNQMLLCDTMIDIEIRHIENIIKKLQEDSTIPQQIKNSPIKLYKKILENTRNGRRCGCGFTGFGDMIASLGLDYNDFSNNQSVTYQITEKIFQTKMLAELDCSIDLAILNGEPFKHFNAKADLSQPFFGNMSGKFRDGYTLKRMAQFGRRNVSWSTAAPTGTISLLAGTTSGIEPLFMPYYIRRVKVDASKQSYDYEDVDGNKFQEFISIHRGMYRWYAVYKGLSYEEAYKELSSKKSGELEEIFKKSPYYKQCANDLNYQARLNCQELVQKYTTHSISSTLNLPNSATQEEISKIYMTSWKLGLKGNTVYRDGCRGGVIVSVDNNNNKKPEHRPESIDGILHRVSINKQWYGILIGFIEKQPYEMFVLNGMSVLKDYSAMKFHGKITKQTDSDGSSQYIFIQNEDDYVTEYENETNPCLIELHDLDDMENKDEKLLSLMISKLFRTGCTVNDVIKLIDKSQPISGTFSSRLIKILGEYAEEEVLDEKCPKCGAKLHRENGCKICKDCGWSACS